MIDYPAMNADRFDADQAVRHYHARHGRRTSLRVAKRITGAKGFPTQRGAIPQLFFW